jgi:hypothetical protein
MCARRVRLEFGISLFKAKIIIGLGKNIRQTTQNPSSIVPLQHETALIFLPFSLIRYVRIPQSGPNVLMAQQFLDNSDVTAVGYHDGR